MSVPASQRETDLAAASRLAEVEAHVQCRLGGRINDFRLVVSADGLILRGHAHTYYGKQLALHAVMEMTRLPIVANDIEVS